MSKVMNELDEKIINYDLKMGLFIAVFIGIVLSFKLALIFMLGLIISIINLITTKFIIIKWTNKLIIILSTLLRIMLVVMISIPFIYEMGTILAYLLGYSSHFIFLMIYCLRNN
ncbi:MAG: hypothetical protein ACRC7N_18520 [Clostridium sp.]